MIQLRAIIMIQLRAHQNKRKVNPIMINHMLVTNKKRQKIKQEQEEIVAQENRAREAKQKV